MADIEARRFVACRIRNCILNILRQIEEGNEGECLGNVHFRLEWLLDIVMRYYQTDLIEREIVNLLHDALRNLTNVQTPQKTTMKPRQFSLEIVDDLAIIFHTNRSRFLLKDDLP